ncbi:MAG TPA: hypothetical protein PKI62_07310 [bacterium]|nr:hypothetical protein [bacterium]HPR87198.1 hypothetical protein [bacterium]
MIRGDDTAVSFFCKGAGQRWRTLSGFSLAALMSAFLSLDNHSLNSYISTALGSQMALTFIENNKLQSTAPLMLVLHLMTESQPILAANKMPMCRISQPWFISKIV